MDAKRRLLFWLTVPYIADAGLVIAGVWYLVAGDSTGWWILVFAAGRVIVGTIALVWIAPRMIGRKSSSSSRDERGS